MKTFQLLYFRGSLLERAEEVRVGDVVEAVELGCGQPPDVRVEVWSNGTRVGVIGSSSRR
jgi:hypothetical protein